MMFRALGSSFKDLNTTTRYIIERSGVPVLSSGRLP